MSNLSINSACSVSAPKKKSRLLLLSIFLFMCGIVLFTLTAPLASYKTPLFLLGSLLCFTGMLGLRHHWPVKWGVVTILAVAAITRAILLPLPPNDDLNRYAWEGKCQLNNISPFDISPISPKTETLRDTIWQGVNHKDFTTIYGPVAQLIFKATAFLHYSTFMFKVVVTLFDLGTLLLLLLFLKRRGSRYNEALLYALNPLVLFSFAAEGHIESLLLFMLAGAVTAYQRRKFPWLFIFLGAACGVKLTAAMFIPLFIRKDTLKYLPFLIIPALTALPYGSSITALFSVTSRFGAEFHFNGFMYTVLSPHFNHCHILLICSLVFVVIFVWNFFLTPDPLKASGNIALFFLLLSPTAHPWYFTVVALFAALYPERVWIVLTGTANLSWMVSFAYWATGVWRESVITIMLEYIPPFLLNIIRQYRSPGFASPDYGIPKSIAIIIPVLNEGDSLAGCLDAITFPEHIKGEIIIVDGGSTDNTRSVAQSDSRATFITSEQGRGNQIANGFDRSGGDLVIVVHADTTLMDQGINQIYHFCCMHPAVCGGSVAARFNASGFRFTVITLLNTLRSRLSGISFGDQVQFFRRAALKDALPRVQLMEDIEISLLLKERGVVAALPFLAVSSSRRWKKRAYAGNVVTILSLTALYLIRRRCGALKADNSDFYRYYYGNS